MSGKAIPDEAEMHEIESDEGECHKMSQIATNLRPNQVQALEGILLGHSDYRIASSLGLRRETIWRWRTTDPEFKREVQSRQRALAESAAERLRGLFDQAVDVVQDSFSSGRADPKLALLLLRETGVLNLASEPAVSAEPDERGAGAPLFSEAQVEELMESFDKLVGSEVKAIEGRVK